VRAGSFLISTITAGGYPAILRPTQQEAGMNAKARRKIEMGARALEFSRAHPDTEPGADAIVTKLEQLLARASEVATAQRDGLIHVHAAKVRKDELRRGMLEIPIAHMAEVGAAAAREKHELGSTFRFKPGADTSLAFQTAARGMASAAHSHREILLKHGLAQSVLDQLVQMLDQFDAAVVLGNQGRTAHIGATRDLTAVSQEIARTVRVMDGRNRLRFADDAQLLGSWLGASRILGERRTATEDEPAVPDGEAPAGGDVRPAA
jgi:hypothetical protein